MPKIHTPARKRNTPDKSDLQLWPKGSASQHRSSSGAESLAYEQLGDLDAQARARAVALGQMTGELPDLRTKGRLVKLKTLP